ncbi:unnamed protein product [Vitrella brassicaformis CCMP3155]|uniref:Reverse transcriptase domain-containing protein n=1 Tax=Vitrella brassicaformis (strain CCMP3155) TaxID=1169540 RepID=A0A0G4EX58_VITBC|nr:unnamed protein product [Vitrella brassicaformis CCMP3155]|eukprot:CEM03378.1 unnamed protein product [Vitrella brassicaformis CCMP3155]
MDTQEATKGCIKRRAALWRDDEFEVLVAEVEDVQTRLEESAEKAKRRGAAKRAASSPARFRSARAGRIRAIDRFKTMIGQGRTTAAVKHITNRAGGGPMQPGDPADPVNAPGRTVLDVLRGKHPPRHPPAPGPFTEPPEELPKCRPAVVTEAHIERAARQIRGGAGPVAGDARVWEALLLKYDASKQLREAFARATNKINSENVDWRTIAALRDARLIALDKQPGVRPIGIGEVPFRIMTKAICIAARREVEQACGTLQLCAGQQGGIEAACHVVSSLMTGEPLEPIHPPPSEAPADNAASSPAPPPPPLPPICVKAMLALDGTNAWNTTARPNALWQVRRWWPSASRFIWNVYKFPARLHVGRGTPHLYSREGVTQGDPAASLIFACASLPMFEELQRHHPRVIQVNFADDGSGLGDLPDLRGYLDDAIELGKEIRYLINTKKCVLVVQPGDEEEAACLFEGTEVRIVTDAEHLGAMVGTPEAGRAYVQQKVAEFVADVRALSEAASRVPQEALYAAAKSLQAKWIYLRRVMHTTCEDFEVLRDTITDTFLPALVGTPQPLSDDMKRLLLRPVRHGGIGLVDPSFRAPLSAPLDGQTDLCQLTRKASRAGTTILAHAIATSAPRLPAATHRSQMHRARRVFRESLDETFAHDSTAIIGRLPLGQARAAERTRCNDTGQFMTVRPSQLDDTDLSALEFRDAMCHRYGLPHQDMPDKCDGERPNGARCGADFTVQHALGCSLGGLVYAKHDRLKHEVGGLCQLGGLKVAYEHTVWKETAHAAAARDPRAVPLEGALG